MAKLKPWIVGLLAVGCMSWLGVTGCSHEKPKRQAAPPGWKLQTDGKAWRWVKPDGSSWLPLNSRQEAIDNAWAHFEYHESNWKPAN